MEHRPAAPAYPNRASDPGLHYPPGTSKWDKIEHRRTAHEIHGAADAARRQVRSATGSRDTAQSKNGLARAPAPQRPARPQLAQRPRQRRQAPPARDSAHIQPPGARATTAPAPPRVAPFRHKFTPPATALDAPSTATGPGSDRRYLAPTRSARIPGADRSNGSITRRRTRKPSTGSRTELAADTRSPGSAGFCAGIASMVSFLPFAPPPAVRFDRLSHWNPAPNLPGQFRCMVRVLNTGPDPHSLLPSAH